MIGRTVALVALLAIIGAAHGRHSPRPDDEDREVTLMRGRHVFKNNCLMCHATPIVDSQRLTAEQWKAEVTKMVGWGAPVADEDREPLLAFLHQNYGENVARVRPGRITIQQAETALQGPREPGNRSPGGDLARGAHLFAKHCASCHGANAKGTDLGTNLVEKPILDRWTEFRTVVRDGRHRMPGFKQALDPAAETDLLFWLFNGQAK